MIRSSLSEALRAASARNEELLGFYREAARKSSSKRLSVLAAAAAEQRHSQGEEIRNLIDELGPQAASLELTEAELAGAKAETKARQGLDEEEIEEAFYSAMRDAELADQARFSALALRAASLSGELQFKLDSFALQAHKRAELATNHLDLLFLGRAGRST